MICSIALAAIASVAQTPANPINITVYHVNQVGLIVAPEVDFART
jgi:hypothetical protein